mgnify:CR=1 FL=1
MNALSERASKLARLALRSWSRGRLPCAERLRRYLRRVPLSATIRRRDRDGTADLLTRVPRIFDDEWPPWLRAKGDAAHKRRRG